MRKSTRFGLLTAMSGLLLTGCQTAPSRVLPDLVPYPQEVQLATAQEMTGAACPVMAAMIVDYGLVRDQIRALGDPQ